ncbi:hypothetical protein CDL15_Pgr012588 [Punica granatum]|uniref:WAT1-related protein n=1 Tax=Punica granatum TaxID=22663 RepID=A0A218XZI7_PUNGR|nr:hypothetical protein CDL15_Pgr012588 [Punica granatum]
MGKLEDMKPVMAMLVLQFTYAGVNLFSRAAVLQGMNPRVFVVYRHAMATLFIAPVAFLSRWGKSNRASMGLKSFSLIFLAALVGVVINQNMYTEGLYLVSASIASAMANLVPAITFIMAYALRGELLLLGILAHTAGNFIYSPNFVAF